MDYPLKYQIRLLINLLIMRWIYYVNCTECKSDNIWYDDLRGELFCADCGLVLERKYEIVSIPDIIDYMKSQEQKERAKMMKSLE